MSDEQIKPGYKRTEVGDIPEDWEIKKLGQLVSSVEYGSSAKSSAKGPIPVLRMGNLQDGKIDWNDLVFTSNENEINKYSLKPGDVLFNRTNTIDLVGKTSIYDGKFPAIFAGYLIRINTNKALLDSRFLNFILNADFSRKHSEKILTIAIGQANINSQKLKNYPIPVPPTVGEQDSIATALSDVDDLLAKLGQLIAKNRDLKQAAMQQLLTGQTRLPGFSGDWEVKRLGDLADIDPENLGSNTAQEYHFNYISLEDIDCGTLRSWSEQVFGTAPSRARRILKPGDVLVSTVRPNLKSHFHFKIDSPHWICSTGFSVVRCRDGVTSPAYVFHQFFANEISRQIEMILTGSNYPAINSKDVRALEIPIPSYTEQTAIAAALSDMDAEIAALESRRDKTRALKQGMMQDLLTGRIRLM